VHWISAACAETRARLDNQRAIIAIELGAILQIQLFFGDNRLSWAGAERGKTRRGWRKLFATTYLTRWRGTGWPKWGTPDPVSVEFIHMEAQEIIFVEVDVRGKTLTYLRLVLIR
jgi:hypothetical protein